MRKLLLVWLAVMLVGGSAAAQGLSPKAGTVSDGLYTNLYFGMNYKLPADWAVSYAAEGGPCPRECLLLDARGPGENTRRALSVYAELLTAVNGSERVTLAGVTLEQAGAKKIAPARQITLAGRTSYRADYRSTVATGEVYYTIVMLPSEQYAVVFSFSSDSRKHLDAMVDDLSKSIHFVGGS